MVVKRVAVPQPVDWKPFVEVLKRDLAVKDELSRQSRFALIGELLSHAIDEPMPNRAAALFHLSLEQSRLLENANGVDRYASVKSKRFETTTEDAKVEYLVEVIKGLTSEESLPQLMQQFHRLIQNPAVQKSPAHQEKLLNAMADVCQRPAGRALDKKYFENWLSGLKKLSEVAATIEPLRKKTPTGLSASEHRMLGSFECFVEGKWAVGLGHFSKSDLQPAVVLSSELKKLDGANVDHLESIANQWWIASQKAEEFEVLFKRRAQFWYSEYAKRVGARNVSNRAESRLKDLNRSAGVEFTSSSRSPRSIVFVVSNRNFPTGGNGGGKRLTFIDSNHVAIESSFEISVMRLTDMKRVYNRVINDSFDHPIPVWNNSKIGRISQRDGVQRFDLTGLISGDSNIKVGPTRLRTNRIAVRAFDVAEDETVFGLSENKIYRWTAAQAWGGQQGAPESVASPADFIPDQIRVIPNGNGLAVADKRNLTRISRTNKATKLVSAAGLLDFDFPRSGTTVAISTDKEMRIKALRGSRDLVMKAQPAASKVRFLSNSRFLASLHGDGSVQLWDSGAKNGEYLLDWFQPNGFKAVDLAVSPDGKQVALMDSGTNLRFLDLHYQ